MRYGFLDAAAGTIDDCDDVAAADYSEVAVELLKEVAVRVG